MTLSNNALKELRIELMRCFGAPLANQFSDGELDEIGMFLLTALAEATKMQIQSKSIKKGTLPAMSENSNTVMGTVG